MMKKVLIVEDSRTVSMVMEQMLAERDYCVRVANHGLAALHMVQSFKPDAILLDIRLPHIDGYQICVVVRNIERFKNTPIIIVSGLSDEASIQRALDAGANDYLVKPVDVDTLVNTIELYLSLVEV